MQGSSQRQKFGECTNQGQAERREERREDKTLIQPSHERPCLCLAFFSSAITDLKYLILMALNTLN